MKNKLMAISLVVSLVSTTAFGANPFSCSSNGEESYVSRAKNKVVNGASYVKDTISSGVSKSYSTAKDGVSWSIATTQNGAQGTYGVIWGNRSTWQRAAEVTAAVVALGYYFQESLPESVRATLGLEATEDEYAVQTVR